jgi:uncharacterized RDD family membrane protein YckC
VGAFVLDCALLFLVLRSLGELMKFCIQWRTPSTGPGIWLALALNFSVPTWIYLIVSDSSARGATVGKRLSGLRVRRVDGGRLGLGRALLRTAVKLLPWELTHFSAFALMRDPNTFESRQLVGVGIANGLALLYLLVAACTRGLRSVHDYVARTEVVASVA